MYKDPTEWRDGFKRWRETGESPWKAGKRLPKFEDGKDVVPESKRARAMYNTIDPRGDVPQSYWEAAKKEGAVLRKMLFGNVDEMDYEIGTELPDRVSDAAWRKRLGYSYDKKLLIPYINNSVRLPQYIELEIPTDTTMLKNRIKSTENLMNYSNKYKYDKYVRLAKEVDEQALQALRETYKSGKPVVVNEHSFNSRHWVNDGNITPTMSPLNVLGNYTIWYDKNKNRMHYKDTYDFNKYDWGVPGNAFDIGGYVDLNIRK